MGALSPEKYEVVPIGVTRAGSWLVGSDPARLALESGTGAIVEETGSKPTLKAGLMADPTCQGLVVFNGGSTGNSRMNLDVLFPLIHGTYGEDGTIQGLLELADLPYVGCGVLASALGMDKTASKRIFRDIGIPVATFMEVLRNDWKRDPEAVCQKVEAAFAYPCFIKPVNSGSSVGISKARDRASLIEAFALAGRYDRKILVESFVDGRELEVSVMGNDSPLTSVVGEIFPCNEFYDYKAKYIDNRSGLAIPADLPAEVSEKIRSYAEMAFRVLDCAGMARVDFFLEKKTGQIYISEINTIPGFTSISMYPKLWEATGVSYPELVDRLVQMAFERHAEKQETLKAVCSHGPN